MHSDALPGFFYFKIMNIEFENLIDLNGKVQIKALGEFYTLLGKDIIRLELDIISENYTYRFNLLEFNVKAQKVIYHLSNRTFNGGI